MSLRMYPTEAAGNPMARSGGWARSAPLILPLLLLTLVFVGAGYWLATMAMGTQDVQESRRLEAVAQLKQQQLGSWLGERWADARAMRSDSGLSELYVRWRGGDAGSG